MVANVGVSSAASAKLPSILRKAFIICVMMAEVVTNILAAVPGLHHIVKFIVVHIEFLSVKPLIIKAESLMVSRELCVIINGAAVVARVLELTL